LESLKVLECFPYLDRFHSTSTYWHIGRSKGKTVLSRSQRPPLNHGRRNRVFLACFWGKNRFVPSMLCFTFCKIRSIKWMCKLNNTLNISEISHQREISVIQFFKCVLSALDHTTCKNSSTNRWFPIIITKVSIMKSAQNLWNDIYSTNYNILLGKTSVYVILYKMINSPPMIEGGRCDLLSTNRYLGNDVKLQKPHLSCIRTVKVNSSKYANKWCSITGVSRWKFVSRINMAHPFLLTHLFK